MQSADQPRALLNLQRYPVHEPDSADCRALVTRVQSALQTDGCAVLKQFLNPSVIPGIVAEVDSVAHHGWRTHNRTNAYFTRDDPSLPESHPVRQFHDRSNAFIPADNFAEGSALRSLYQWPDLLSFVQRCLGETCFYRYADPLADVIVNSADEGDGFPWHFDTNNYTVTLALQNAEHGGEFEYVPNIRSADDENYETVAKVLSGDNAGVRTLRLEAGDLQLFRGRYSLHRVAPLSGRVPRYVAIFSYAERPDMVGSPERTRQLYGRVLPIHFEYAGRRSDPLRD